MAVLNEVGLANLALQRIGEPTIASLADSGRNAEVVNQLYDQNRDFCLKLTDWSFLIRRETLDRSASVAITGVTQASPAVVSTNTTHTIAARDILTLDGMTGMEGLEDGVFLAKSVTSTTITLETTKRATVDSTSFTAWSSGGNVYRHATSDWQFVYDEPTDMLKLLDVLDEYYAVIPEKEWKREQRGFIYTNERYSAIRYLEQDTDPANYDEELVELMASRLSWQIAQRIRGRDDVTQSLWGDYQRMLVRTKQMQAIGQQSPDLAAKEWVKVF